MQRSEGTVKRKSGKHVQHIPCIRYTDSRCQKKKSPDLGGPELLAHTHLGPPMQQLQQLHLVSTANQRQHRHVMAAMLEKGSLLFVETAACHRRTGDLKPQNNLQNLAMQWELFVAPFIIFQNPCFSIRQIFSSIFCTI